jgi:hypothetical protein
MIGLLCFVLTVLAAPIKSKMRLEAENAVLRHHLPLSLVARGVGITLATRAAIESSQLRNWLKIVAIWDFDLKVRAWVVHRPPVGRLANPIECLNSALKPALETPDHSRSEPHNPRSPPTNTSRRLRDAGTPESARPEDHRAAR